MAGRPISQMRRQHRAVGRFLAIYNGASDDASKAELTEQQQADFLHAWATWAQTHHGALIDPGAPLNAKKLLTADEVEDFTDASTGYAILRADLHEEAVRIFSRHPHLRLFPGNSIAVLECPSVSQQLRSLHRGR